MDSQTLRRLQLIELGILVEFNNYCKKHDLEYTLVGGTAIGAIRHGGFIPWDDDIDVAMSRNTYERFLNTWEENPITGYFLQSSRDRVNTDMSHSKLRKDRTVLTNSFECRKFPNGHHGVWIDIFPLDKAPNKNFTPMINIYAIIRMIYVRNMVIDYRGSFTKLLSKLLLSLPMRMQVRLYNHTDKYLLKFNTLQADFLYRDYNSILGLKTKYPGNIFDDFIDVQFENIPMRISSNYDSMLRAMYGDYMLLPPVENRVCKHVPEMMDF